MGPAGTTAPAVVGGSGGPWICVGGGWRERKKKFNVLIINIFILSGYILGM